MVRLFINHHIFFLDSPWEVDLVIGETSATSASQNPRRQVIEVQHCACWGRWRGYPGRSWRLPKSFFFGSTYSYYRILMDIHIYIHNYIYCVYIYVYINMWFAIQSLTLLPFKGIYDMIFFMSNSVIMEDIQDWQWQMEINRGLRDKVNRNFDKCAMGAGQKKRPNSRNCTDCGSI